MKIKLLLILIFAIYNVILGVLLVTNITIVIPREEIIGLEAILIGSISFIYFLEKFMKEYL